MFTDTHVHLMFEQFEGEVPEVLRRASEAGVGRVINVGCSKKASKQAFAQIEEHTHKYGVEMFSTVGLHPYDASELDEHLLKEWERMIAVADGRIVAVGEIGLDYFKAPVPHDIQKKAFRGQLEFAAKMGLPVIVHDREADEDCLEILDGFPDLKVVFHCYASSLEFAQKLWSRGYYTSFTGIITYPKSDELREVVKECPADRFMVETDCPYLAPQKYRGERNEPAYVVAVARAVAELRGLSLENAEVVLEANTKKFFGI